MTRTVRPNAASAPDLAAMGFFATAMEVSSFAAAARRLALSRSVVSRRIAAIEARLGIALLRRTTRSLVLTEAGQDYLEHCRRVVALASEGERSARGLTDAPSGVVRIAAPPSLGRLLLAPLLRGFAERFPQVNIDLRLSVRLVDLIEEGYDLAFRLTDQPPLDLHARQIDRFSYVLCTAPDYFAKLPKPLQPEQLNHVDWLAFGNQQKQMRLKLVAPDGSSTRIAVMPRLQCNDLDALYRAARSGMGVIMLPKQILIEDFAETRLVPVLPEYQPEAGYPSSIWALSAPGPRVSAKVRVFWEYMLESLAHKL